MATNEEHREVSTGLVVGLIFCAVVALVSCCAGCCQQASEKEPLAVTLEEEVAALGNRVAELETNKHSDAAIAELQEMVRALQLKVNAPTQVLPAVQCEKAVEQLKADVADLKKQSHTHKVKP